jgi:type III secretion protein V
MRQRSRSLVLQRTGRIADAVLACVVMLIIAMMIMPLPTWALDQLIALNLGLSLLLLITALYLPQGLALTSMPSVLLIGTLYRLALNVSSTRLILLQADAGRVIRAFGDFLVRGDYIVGAVIFLIVSLIQYLVVAKGGERVAEVAARFALDAMPGKQLAIDADLRAGGLHVAAAQVRRAELERESRFYGAMDGAMKFVKGDAIASLIITSVAFVGGTAVGVWNRGLSFEAALKLYGLLAIGDGLVSQLPALITSTAAGLVVTRVAEQAAGSLGGDVASQLFERPRTLFAVAAALGLLAAVPGLPAPPFAVLALLSAGRAVLSLRAQQAAPPSAADTAPPTLLLELGPQLSAALERSRTPGLTAVFASQLSAIAAQLDVPLPTWQSAHNAQLADRAFVLNVRQAPCLRGQAENLSALTDTLESELRPLLERRARELLALETVQQRLDELSRWAPSLVQNVVPRLFTLAQLTEILRRLLDERASIHALERICEALSQCEREAANSERGLELARRALRERLCEAHVQAGVLYVHAVDPLIEDTLRDATRAIAGERVVALALELASDIVQAVRKFGASPVIVTQSDVRRSLFEVLRDEVPAVTVLAYSELPSHIAVERSELITISA